MDLPLPRPDPLSEPLPAAQGSSFDSSKLTAVTSMSLWPWLPLSLAQGVLGGPGQAGPRGQQGGPGPHRSRGFGVILPVLAAKSLTSCHTWTWSSLTLLGCSFLNWKMG